MTPYEYNALAGQVAEDLRHHLHEGGGYASLNLMGQSLLHNWVQVGSASRSALSTLCGEPVILKINVVLERPVNRETND